MLKKNSFPTYKSLQFSTFNSDLKKNKLNVIRGIINQNYEIE